MNKIGREKMEKGERRPCRGRKVWCDFLVDGGARSEYIYIYTYSNRSIYAAKPLFQDPSFYYD